MYNVRNVTNDIYWVGSNDRRLALFENIHPIAKGVSYNSYLLLDEKTVLFDTIDWSCCRQLLENLDYLLNGRKLDYIVINHMEPDHGASLEEILIRYPEVEIISTQKAFAFMKQYGFSADKHNCIVVKENDTFSFGKHEVIFIGAAMVHWPEAMVTLDTTDGVLFSADAFGTFGALNGKLFIDEMDIKKDVEDEARRYYTNIVGKYGPQVQTLLKKASAVLDKIKLICPLHGPVWNTEFDYILDKYTKWSTYEPEEKGVMVVYASMYGNTEAAAEALCAELVKKGIKNVELFDVSSTHVSYLISNAFKYSHIVLASVTYNAGIYPLMHNFLEDMKALNVQNRTFAIMENGTWASSSGNLMQKFVEENIKNSTVLESRVKIMSSLSNDKAEELKAMADAIIQSL